MFGYRHSELDLLHAHIPDMKSISLLTLTYQKDVIAASHGWLIVPIN